MGFKPEFFKDKDMGWDKLYTTFQAGNSAAVFVGFLRSSGVHKKGKGMTVAQIAAINEFGSSDGKIPERNFMRSSLSDAKSELEKLLNKVSIKVLDGKLGLKQGLGLVGEFVKGQMIKKINSGVPPSNAQSTIDRKGSSRTLIDTGQLKGSIDFEVHLAGKISSSKGGK